MTSLDVLPPSTAPSAPRRALVCLWGELRGIRAAVESFLTYLVEPLDAEVVVLCQHQLQDDVERLTLLRSILGDRLLASHLYEKPTPEDFFGETRWAAASKVRGNWNNPGNRQVLMNHCKLKTYLEAEGLLDRYEVYVFSRCDMLHVFPFPTCDDLVAVLDPHKDILTQAGHEFGGVNYNLATMRAPLVADYLEGPRHIISKGFPNSKTYNIERFMGLILGSHGWRNLRMPVSAFITADQLTDRSTWKTIKECKKRENLLFKYGAQLEEAFKNAECWSKHGHWFPLSPPRRFQVEEIHGRAVRPFAYGILLCQLC